MDISQVLNNYQHLLAKTDERCREILKNYAGHIRCKKGCAVCCRHISVFPIEAAAMRLAVKALPEAAAEHIRKKVRTASPEGECPLLEDGACLLYDSRPVICRTHGFPIFFIQDGTQRIDVCPLNFEGVSSLPGQSAIDLEPLNQMLSMINRMFISNCVTSPLPERFTIAEVFICEPLTLNTSHLTLNKEG
ncbi:MAG TPA: YkgJ family cysteine cluster protein [Desulfobacteraceae bacterium]|nr:YkgJ family cysteine cluster protein [Desulfobacteraceae bacterium]